MGAIVRSILARTSLVFWGAAGGLALARTISGGHLHDLGWVILSAGLGASSDVTGAIARRDRRERVLLAEALAASQRDAAGQESPVRHLRAL